MRLRHASGSRKVPEFRRRGQDRLRRAASCGCALVLTLLAARAPAETAAPNASRSEPGTRGTPLDEPAPHLAITVFAKSDGIGTFAERVRSWFHDGTTVSVEPAAQSHARVPGAAQPGVVRIWVILLSNEQALVTFSMRTAMRGERHLVRDVRLRSALDELGLERLASVIQSTVVAMREGLEGSDLQTLKTELKNAGFEVHGASTATGATDAATPAPPGPASTASPPRIETPPPPASPAQKRETGSPREERIGQRSVPRFDVGYGARYGGDPGLLHGPSLGFGWPFDFEAGALWLSFRAAVFLPASVAASPFRLSLQTSSVRAGIAFERRTHTSLSEYAALLGGVDVTHMSSRLQSDTGDQAERYEASHSATRVWGELGLVAGVWYRAAIDIGIFGAVDYCLSDVRYVVESSSGDRNLFSPWRLQPALFLSGRFGVTPLD